MPVPDPLIISDPGRMAGTPCFAGTRVPVYLLFEYLEDGAPLSEFLTSYPNVSREHAIAVLKASKASVILGAVEREPYVASDDELAAIDEARGQIARGERATEEEVEAVFARFRS